MMTASSTKLISNLVYSAATEGRGPDGSPVTAIFGDGPVVRITDEHV